MRSILSVLLVLAAALCVCADLESGLADLEGLSAQLAVQQSAVDNLLREYRNALKDEKKRATASVGAGGSSKAESSDDDLSWLHMPRSVSFLPDQDYVGGPERVHYLPSFLSEDEAEELVELGETRFQKSVIMGDEQSEGGTGAQDLVDSTTRSSLSAFFSSDEFDHIMGPSILQRCHEVTKLPRGYGEDLQVTKYPTGAMYTFHYDSSMGVGRAATVLVFLNTLEDGKGGETVFPLGRLTAYGRAKRRMLEEGRGVELLRAGSAVPDDELDKQAALDSESKREAARRQAETGERDGRWSALPLIMPGLSKGTLAAPMEPFCNSEKTLKFRPKRGDALVWFNHDGELGMDRRSLHGGCPTKNGATKYIMQRWQRFYHAQRGNEFMRLMEECGVEDPVHGPRGLERAERAWAKAQAKIKKRQRQQ